jgi:hypothetical protein
MKRLLTYLLSFTCLIVSPHELKINDAIIHETEKEFKILSYKDKEFTLGNLIEYIKLKDSVNYETILRMTVLETGWFKSTLFTKHNNLFGMMYHKRYRKTTAKGVAFLYSVNYQINDSTVKCITYHPSSYNHWTESVDDYFLFLDYWKNKGKCPHEMGYYNFLSKIGYAVEKHYVKALKSIDLVKLSKKHNYRLT